MRLKLFKPLCSFCAKFGLSRALSGMSDCVRSGAMVTSSIETKDYLTQYRSEGYAFIGSIMTPAELEMFRREEIRFREWKWETNPASKNEGTIFASQVSHYSEAIRKYVSSGPHVKIAKQLVSQNLVMWFTQFVTKFPDRNQNRTEFPWHQDNGYVSILPATNITIWIALDDVDEENGCVWVQPDSHKLGLLPHKTKSQDSWHLQVPVEGDGVPARLKAGEAVAFTGLTLHRSKENKTEKPRRGFFIEYADAICRTANDNKCVIHADSSFLVSGAAPLEKEFVLWI